MQAVALVSGGKDSFMAMQLAMEAGHKARSAPPSLAPQLTPPLTPPQIVLLANLYPAQADCEELDSHMFQTVGHSLLPHYAACAALPLLRRRTAGASTQRSLEYTPAAAASVPSPETDEVEDLRQLLLACKARHPSLAAVVSGAILSDYQRLRVESCCASLGLVSLAPLWRLDQGRLLERMSASGLRAVLVKTASLGLDASHLGCTVEELTPLLKRLGRKYGVHPAGEGGEFETLVLDCAAFPRARLELGGDWERLTLPGGESRLRLGSVRVVLKEGGKGVAAGEVLEADSDLPSAPVSFPVSETEKCPPLVPVHACAGRSGLTLHASAPSAPSAPAALSALLSSMAAAVSSRHLKWTDSVLVQLCLPDMSDFAAVNAVYLRSAVPPTAPPARACIQHASRRRLSLSLTFSNASNSNSSSNACERKAMHVQSLSGWAPACIGPYAQSVRLGVRFLAMAGALGLTPFPMTLPPSLTQEAHNAFLACDAVSRAWLPTSHLQVPGASVRFELARVALGCTVYVTDEEAEGEARAAWGLLRSGALSCPPAYSLGEDGGLFESNIGDAERPAFEPPFLFLRVPALPRGARVEVQPLVMLPTPASLSFEFEDVRIRTTRSNAAGGGCEAAAVAGEALRALIPFQKSVVDVSAAVEVAGKALAEAGLGWGDVWSLRLYWTGAEVEEDEADGEAVCDAFAAALEAEGEVRPQLVVVDGVTVGEAEARAALEVTAWRAPEPEEGA